MEDIATKLLENVQYWFKNRFDTSETIFKLYEKIQEGIATYSEANEFAIEVGEILAESYKSQLSSDVLPDGKMYYNIAKRVIVPMMEYNYDLITNVTRQVQKLLNDAAGIGIKPLVPELNKDRIEKIVDRVSKEDVFDDIKWMLDGPVENFCLNIVDDSVRMNAQFHAEAGLQTKVVRKLVGRGCDWCRALAGIYSYPDDVPEDIYRRHQRCRCVVEYNPRDGKIQNVHTKKWRDENARDKIEVRKKVGLVKEEKNRR